MKITPKQRYWLDHVKRADNSGLRYTTYARQENINHNALYNWKSILIKKGLLASAPSKASPFVDITPSVTMIPSRAMWGHTPSMIDVVLPNGILIRLDELRKEILDLLVTL